MNTVYLARWEWAPAGIWMPGKSFRCCSSPEAPWDSARWGHRPSWRQCQQGKVSSNVAFAGRSSACMRGTAGNRVGALGHQLLGGGGQSALSNRYKGCSRKWPFLALGALLHPWEHSSCCHHRGHILTLWMKEKFHSQKWSTSLLCNQTSARLFTQSIALGQQPKHWGRAGAAAGESPARGFAHAIAGN